MMIVWKTADDNIPHVNDVVMVTREGLWGSALAPRLAPPTVWQNHIMGSSCILVRLLCERRVVTSGDSRFLAPDKRPCRKSETPLQMFGYPTSGGRIHVRSEIGIPTPNEWSARTDDSGRYQFNGSGDRQSREGILEELGSERTIRRQQERINYRLK